MLLLRMYVFTHMNIRNDMPVIRLGLVFGLLQRRQLSRDAFRYYVSVPKILDGTAMQGTDHLSRSTLQTSFRLSRLCEWDKKICKSLCMHAMIHPINQPCRLLYIYIYIYLYVASCFVCYVSLRTARRLLLYLWARMDGTWMFHRRGRVFQRSLP